MLKMVAFKFEHNGVEGELYFESTVPNKRGNIIGVLDWGEIEEFPDFRSLEEAEAFVNDEDEIGPYIDDAVQCRRELQALFRMIKDGSR